MGWGAWKHFPSSGPCRSLSTRRSSFLAKAPRGVDWKHCRQNCPRNANVTLFSAGNVRWKSLTLCAKVGSTKPAVIFDTTIFQQRVLLATSDNFLLFELAHVLNLLEVLCHQPLPHKLWNCGSLSKLFKLLNLKSMASWGGSNGMRFVSYLQSIGNIWQPIFETIAFSHIVKHRRC